MVEIYELPIEGKIKEKFIKFVDANGLGMNFIEFNRIGVLELNVFSKSTGKCAVCDKPLKWGCMYGNGLVLGVVCNANYKALQACKGDLSVINFERKKALEIKTMHKRHRELKEELEAIKYQTMYNDIYLAGKRILEKYDVKTLPEWLALNYVKIHDLDYWLFQRGKFDEKKFKDACELIRDFDEEYSLIDQKQTAHLEKNKDDLEKLNTLIDQFQENYLNTQDRKYLSMREFLESLREWIQNGRDLTPNQKASLAKFQVR